MNDSPAKLQHELETAQAASADLQAKLDHAQTGKELAERELGENRSALLFMLEDLDAERKKIEQAHQELSASLDAMRDLIFMHDQDYRVMRSNRAYAERAGMSVRDVIGKPYYEVFPRLDGPMAHCSKALHHSGEEEEEEEIQIESGEVFLSRSFAVRNTDGSHLYSMHIMEDITERKLLENAVRQNALVLEEAQRIAHTGNWELDMKTGAFTWSRELYRIFGSDPSLPAPTLEEFGQTLTPESLVKMRDTIEKIVQTRAPYEIDLELIRLNGNRRWIAARGEVSSDEGAQDLRLRGTVVDITERKQAEIALLHANRAFKTLSACNHELVHATDEAQLLQVMCRIVVETGGYNAAWVGYAQQDAEKTVRPMAHSGFDAGYADTLQIAWSGDERGLGPTGMAVRSAMTQIVQDVANDPACAPWREQAVKHGNASAIALPLLDGAAAFGCLTIYAAKANAFNQDEIDLLEEMAGDLAFGIRMLRLNQEQQRSTEQIRKGLEGTVLAIATMVEMRDPYTAGHQRRVADLATAIAVEMGLPEDQARGIHLAGTIHDLGKIQTPAEILSKPGRLSAAEFSLIKLHPQNGYDILKNIDFPWPIAQMVFQHHERLDGSGYPYGLKGDEILLEARILTVADVMEAMSSHRPYRPGLGLDVALAEIGKGRGSHYDPDVVDACVRLFTLKGYAL